MKPPAFFVMALGLALIVCGCMSREFNLRQSGAKMLTPSELEALFHADRTAEFPITAGVATVTYSPDGRQEIDWGGGKDTGRFRIKGEEFCSTWSRLRKGEESCSKIYKISDTEYEFIDSDGATAAVMRLK
ncbi:MAG: hypothetical protein MUF46_02365 [Desulfobacterales bacterium]|nr:hypothetical protein [Desulfobacterales bacterium]MCU0586257.1 hypothetical protein [Desulfobacterales bacterium]